MSLSSAFGTSFTPHDETSPRSGGTSASAACPTTPAQTRKTAPGSAHTTASSPKRRASRSTSSPGPSTVGLSLDFRDSLITPTVADRLRLIRSVVLGLGRRGRPGRAGRRPGVGAHVEKVGRPRRRARAARPHAQLGVRRRRARRSRSLPPRAARRRAELHAPRTHAYILRVSVEI